MCSYTYVASGIEVSVVVDSTCDNDAPPTMVVVSHSPVTLTCCVKTKCILWTAKWFSRTHNGTMQPLSTDVTLSVDVIEKKEKESFVCTVLSEDMYCNNPRGESDVTLIKCMYVCVSCY